MWRSARVLGNSEHGAGRLNSMLLPVGDAEYHLQMLSDVRSSAARHSAWQA
jgi:hypothetical protein